MSSITASTDIQQQKTLDDVARFTDLALQDIVKTVNGNLDFSTNINCKSLSVTFGSANTSQAVSHGLGRVPAGYLSNGSNVGGVVYDGSSGSSSSAISLQATVAGTYRLIVY